MGILVMLARARRAVADEANRVRFFMIGLAVPTVVVGAVLTLEILVPSVGQMMITPTGRTISIPVLHASVIALPLVTTYAIVVDRGVSVRLAFNMIVRHRLARLVSSSLVLVPVVIVVSQLWIHRAESLQSLLLSWRGAALVLFFVAGLAAFGFRKRVVDTIDRLFFRESYDSVARVLELKKQLPDASSVESVAAQLTRSINSTLHVQSVSILFRNEHGWSDVSGRLDTLSADTTLLWHMEDDPVGADELRAKVSVDEAAWLSDASAALIAPVNDPAGKLIGALVLGEKVSELPFTARDKAYLTATAHIVSPHLQRHLSDGGEAHEEFRLASVCELCDRIASEHTGECPQCGGAQVTLGLPRRIANRYTCERRLGSGAGGVALLALDEQLDRAVVLKTLPQVRDVQVKMLQREAKTMASLNHPGLTNIYDVESWRGLPVLVMEYLPGGTLQQRLENGRLNVNETVDLGVQLYESLQHLHDLGTLHRDIKPSNIGFDAFGRAKLLDFGFASALDRDDPARSYLAGTPKYLPPETFQGEEPGAKRDTWALALVLYEAHTGAHPFEAPDIARTMRAVAREEVRPDWEPELEPFFLQALDKDPLTRPATAADCGALLASAVLTG